MSEKGEDEVWKDESSLRDVLLFVNRVYMGNNSELATKWCETLEEHLYTTIEHFKDINAEEWAALKIPLRVRSLIRKVITVQDDDNNKYKRKKSRHTLNTQTVKKAVSNSSLMITDFVGGVGSAVIDKTKSTVGRIDFPKVTRAFSEGFVEINESNDSPQTAHHTQSDSKKDEKDEGSFTPIKASVRHSDTSRISESSSQPKILRTKSLKRILSDRIDQSESTPNLSEFTNYKGLIGIGGDSSVCTKLLNYFSFYSQSQFFCSGEKTIDAIVYEEKVECKFENCSKENIDELLERDVIILTFSIVDPTSLNNLLLTFMPSLKRRGYPKHLVYLVGIESDKRDPNNRRHVSIEQTEQVLKNLNALTYCEIGRLDTKESSDNIQSLIKNCAGLILSKEKSRLNKNPSWLSKFASIQKMITLQEAEPEINLKKSRLEHLPVQLIFLRSVVTKLRLSSNLLKFFPVEILLLEGLQELDLSFNYISIIPNSIKKLSKLTHLNLESNRLEMLPVSSLIEMTSLQELKLKGNPLSQVPKSFLNRKKTFMISSSTDDNTDSLISSNFTSPSPTPTQISPQVSPRKASSLLFGVEIEKLLEEDRKLIPHLQIPLFLQRSANFIITFGIDKQGIFRLEGNAKTIQELKDSFDTGIYIEYMKYEDVNNVTSLLKLWLRSLPIPLISNVDELFKIADIKEEDQRIIQLRSLLLQLPSSYFRVLSTVIRLCDLVSKNSDSNKMDATNLSRVIATNLVRLPENLNSSGMIEDMKRLQDLVTLLIEKYNHFFVNPNLSEYEQEYLSEFEKPIARISFKLSSKHKSITSMCICSSPNGKRLWLGDDQGVISIWDITDINSISFVKNLETKKRINCIVAVNERVWIGCIENIQIRSGDNGELIKMIDHPGYNFQVTSKRTNIWSFLQSNTSQIKIFDTKRMKVMKEFQIPNRVISIVKIKNEVWIACHNRIIYVYNIKGKELIQEISTMHQERLTALCYVGNSEVWSSANDGIHVWDANTKELKQKIKTTTELMGLMYANDQVWSFSWDASIFVYNIHTKEFIGKLKSYHNQPISSIITTYSNTNCQDVDSWHNITASYDHTFVIWKCRSLYSNTPKN